MFIFGQYRFQVESDRACLVNPMGPLIYGYTIELDGYVIVTMFPVFMRECAKNNKCLTCESQYYFLVFIFVFTDDDTIVDKSNNIHGGYIKQ